MKTFKLLSLPSLILISLAGTLSANDGHGYQAQAAGGYNNGYGNACGGSSQHGCGVFGWRCFTCNRAPNYQYSAALWDNYCDTRHDHHGHGGCGLFSRHGGCGLFAGCGRSHLGFGRDCGGCFGYPNQDCCEYGTAGFTGCHSTGHQFIRGFLTRIGNRHECGSPCHTRSGCGFGWLRGRTGSCFGFPGRDCCGCGGYGVSYNPSGCGVGGRHGVSVFGFGRRIQSGFGGYHHCGCDENQVYASPTMAPDAATPSQNEGDGDAAQQNGSDAAPAGGNETS